MQCITRFAKRLLIVSIPVLISGCGSESPSAAAAESPSPAQVAAVVTVTSSDCSLVPAAAPDKAGLVAFTLKNQTGDRAGIDVWLMPDDKAFDRFAAQAVEDRRLAEAGEPSQSDHAWLGVAPQLRIQWDSSTSQTVSAVLKSGAYAVVCIKSYPKVSEPRLLKVIGPVVIGPA
jgi:hypothetical protein